MSVAENFKQKLRDWQDRIAQAEQEYEPHTERQTNTTLQPDRMSPEEVEADRHYEYQPSPVYYSQPQVIVTRPTIKQYVEEVGLWAIGFGIFEYCVLKLPQFIPAFAAPLKVVSFPTFFLVVGVSLLVYGCHAYTTQSMPKTAIALQIATGFTLATFAIAILL